MHPDDEKFEFAGEQRAALLCTLLSLEAFSSAAQAYCAPVASLAARKEGKAAHA